MLIGEAWRSVRLIDARSLNNPSSRRRAREVGPPDVLSGRVRAWRGFEGIDS
jgi:hypothetical protein